MTESRLPRFAILMAAVLVVWEPLTFAWFASAALERLVRYGAPAFALLVFRSLIVGFGIAVGQALWRGAPDGPRLARWWLLFHAIALVLTFSTPYFPSNRIPGTKGPTLLALLAIDGACWACLRRLEAKGRAS